MVELSDHLSVFHQQEGGYNSPSEAQLYTLVQICCSSDLNTILNTGYSPKRDAML